MIADFWARSGRFFVLGLGIGLALLGLSLFWQETQKSAEVEFLPPTTDQTKEEIVVDIAGAVVQPGVYRLQSGARVNDAVAAASGLAPSADLDLISRQFNLARPLTDGEKLYFPKKGEKVGGGETQVLGVVEGKVSLSSATQAQLETLPGIGPGLAQQIINYRQTHGGFKTIEEIMAVPGIGPKTFEKIKSRLTL